jgi:hypothetical protein
MMSSEVAHAAPNGCQGAAELAAASPDPADGAGFLGSEPVLIAALPLLEVERAKIAERSRPSCAGTITLDREQWHAARGNPTVAGQRW